MFDTILFTRYMKKILMKCYHCHLQVREKSTYATPWRQNMARPGPDSEVHQIMSGTTPDGSRYARGKLGRDVNSPRFMHSPGKGNNNTIRCTLGHSTIILYKLFQGDYDLAMSFEISVFYGFNLLVYTFIFCINCI